MTTILVSTGVLVVLNVAAWVQIVRAFRRLKPTVRVPYLRPSKQLPQAPVLNEVHDGLTPRYTGTDHDAAETVWTQLERHQVPGQHAWYKDRRIHQQRDMRT